MRPAVRKKPKAHQSAIAMCAADNREAYAISRLACEMVPDVADFR